MNPQRKILWVKSFDWYKENKNMTNERIEKAVEDSNHEGNNESVFEILDASGDIANLIEYLLGDKKYRIYSDIDDLDDSINELSGELSSIQGDVYHLTSGMDRIEEKFSSIKEKLNK